MALLHQLLHHSKGHSLERFERVVEDQPDYAQANLYAARCSFAIGDKTRGIRYAKIARRLGESGEFDAWRNGDHAMVRPQTERCQSHIAGNRSTSQ